MNICIHDISLYKMHPLSWGLKCFMVPHSRQCTSYCRVEFCASHLTIRIEKLMVWARLRDGLSKGGGRPAVQVVPHPFTVNTAVHLVSERQQRKLHFSIFMDETDTYTIINGH